LRAEEKPPFPTGGKAERKKEGRAVFFGWGPLRGKGGEKKRGGGGGHQQGPSPLWTEGKGKKKEKKEKNPGHDTTDDERKRGKKKENEVDFNVLCEEWGKNEVEKGGEDNRDQSIGSHKKRRKKGMRKYIYPSA